MKNFTRIVAVMLALLVSCFTFAQDYVEVGDGTSTTIYVPFNGLYNYNWSAEILEQVDIGLDSPVFITGIAYNISNTPSNYYVNDQSIFLGQTDETQWPDGAYDDPLAAGYTQVFDGDINWNGGGWFQIDFDDPFFYDGTNNLVIQYENRDGSWTSGYPRFYYTSNTYHAKYKHLDAYFPSTGSRGSYMTNVRLYYQFAGDAYVEGTVTDGVSELPINGALVTVGDTYQYTGPDGTYALVVNPGDRTLVVEKPGYQTENIAFVAVMDETTYVNPVLTEEVVPPTGVYAEVLPSDVVNISWGAPGTSYEIIYDDGVAENYAVWVQGGNINALKFLPPGYPCEITKGSVYVGDGSYPQGNDILQPFFMALYDDNGTDGMPGTELARVEVVPNDFGWVSFDFGDDAQTIDDGEFYLGMIQGGNYPECLAVGVDESNPSMRSYQRFATGGQGWTVSGFNDFMIRAICVGPAGVANMSFEPSFVEESRISEGHLFMHAPDAVSGFEGTPLYKAASDEPINNRSFTNYTVWRLGYDQVNNPETWELLGNTANLNYRDNAWLTLPEGGYRWAVAANYTAGQSEVGISNILGNNWEADVTINVTLSSGDLPTGAWVSLVNEDGLAAHTYSGAVDETGTINFPMVWKGDYELSVSFFGYDPYTEMVAIYDDAVLDVELMEVLYEPLGLVVDPYTLLATWLAPGVDLDLFIEDWESGSFATNEWTFAPSQGNWQVSSPGNPGVSAEFYWSPSTTNYENSLVSKTFSGLGFPNMTLSFDLYLSDFASNGAEHVAVEVFDGSSWNLVHDFANNGSLSWGNYTYDISQHAVANDFQIRFRAYGADTYDINNWNFDNIMLYGSIDGGSDLLGDRGVNGYAFYLDDDIMTAYVEDTEYQIEPWMVTWGQRYTSSVAAVYNNGYSDKSYYSWTAQYLPPPNDLEGMANGHYAELMWTPPFIAYPAPPEAAQFEVVSEVARESDDVTVDASPVYRNVSVTGGSRDMWDVQMNVPVGVGGGEAGIEFDGTNIYTTKWNGSASNGTFYSYDAEGTYIGEFNISGCGNVRDLAYDGTYMYGAQANTTLWQMDFVNQTMVSTISSPTSVRAIAYDDDRDAFYVNNWSTDITLVDRTGATINSWPIGAFASFYGMAYDNFEPGADPTVWGFSQDGSGGVLVQHDALSGAATGVTYDAAAATGSSQTAGGLYTTADLVNGTASIGGVLQNENIFAFELYPYSGGGGGGALIPEAYNIYKDGAFYAQVDSLTLAYTSEYLVAGWHQFTVTALYGDPTPGESGPALPGPVDIYINGEGTLTGTVSVCGSVPRPIEGAMITAVNVETEETFVAYSGSNGVYSMNVTEATYNLTCEAEDYETQIVENMFVPDETVVEVNFAPCEFPYPVLGVTATRNYEHTECFVDWYAPMFFETMIYDDGVADDVTAWDAAGNINAVRFTPDAYPCEVMGGSVNIYDGSWPAGNTMAPFQVAIYDDNGVDGMPGQVLATMDVAPASNGWVDAIFDEAVVITEGDFYVAMIQGSDYPDCAPIAIDNSYGQARSYSRYVTNNEPWDRAEFQNFMMRAFVYNEADNRDLEKYEVYRLLSGQEELPETWTLLANDLENVTEYNDYTWDELAQGWYRYAVKAVYSYNVSEPAFSNLVPRGYDSEVTVNVRNEDGQAVNNALVTLMSMTNPDQYTYSATTPADGSVYFHEVWNGLYKIIVTREGYNDYNLSDIYITSNTTLNIILQSLCLPPQNFEVNAQTGVATWLPPVVDYEVAFEEGFEGGVIPPGWTQQYLVQNVSWNIGSGGPTGTPGNAHSGNYNATFMGSSATTKLITPAIDLNGALVPKLSFWHTQKGGAGQDELRVYYRTSATGAWVALASYISNIEVWQNETIALPNVTGTYYLAFEAQAPEPAGMGIALDDIQVLKGVAPGADSRALLGFNLYLDGQYVDYTTDYTYTFTGLEIEQAYIAGITAEYTSCTSVMVNYAFTYMPCYLFNPPQNFSGAANPGNQVNLTWEMPEGTADREATVVNEVERTNVPANVDASPMVREIEVTGGSRDMWDIQFNFPCGDASGEAGAETDGSKIYSTKWNGSATNGTFFSYELDGTFNGAFEVSGCGNVRDLAYDGQYFYGSDATAKIWQMDFDAQTLVATLSCPTAVRAIAYDSDLDAFYVNNWSDNVQLIDRSGNVLNSWPVGSYASFYGMAYDNYDEEAEPSVWGFSQDGSGGVLVQHNAASGQPTGMMWDAVAQLAASGTDLAGGLFTYEGLVPGTTTLGGIIQNISIFGYELYGPAGGGGTTGLIGFNVYRNDLKITPDPISALGYTETITPGGEYKYNVTAVYDPDFESCLEDAEVTLCVGCDLDAPQCILAEVQESDIDVLVAWCTPGAVTPEYWISYFTELTHLSWAVPERATLYNVTDFGAEYPVEITQLAHIFYEHPSYPWGADVTFTFKVYATDGATLLYESASIAALGYPDETILVLEEAIPVDGDFYLAIAAHPETGMPSSAAIEDLTNSHGYVGSAGAWEAYELEWASRVKIRTAAADVMLQANTSGHSVNVATDVATIDEPVEVRDLNRAILLGYNVWRNGDVVSYVPAPDTMYYDMNLAPGEYSYCVTAIYDEGESTPICAEPVSVEAKGMIAGTVFDGTSGTVLQGVEVTVGDISTTTGYDGYYEMVVPSGVVDVMAEKSGFATKVKTATVYYDQTTTLDFNLYPEGVVFTVPFVEPWDDGFEDQNWSFAPEQGNWKINDGAGLPAPAAEFNWSPTAEDYSYALVSPQIDGEGVTNVALSFDLYLSDFAGSGMEHLGVEVFNGTEWMEVADIPNNGNIEWENYLYDITDYALNELFQVRFVAYGTTTYDINYWYVDNVNIYERLLANVYGQVTVCATGDPVAGATITVGGYEPVVTDAGGYYSVAVEYGTYDLACEMDGYNVITETAVEISADYEWNNCLTAPVMRVEPLELTVEVDEGTIKEVTEVTVFNDGDGLLNWTSSVDFISDEDVVVPAINPDYPRLNTPVSIDVAPSTVNLSGYVEDAVDLLRGSDAYCYDAYPGTYGFHNIDTDAPGSPMVINPTPNWSSFAGDFDKSGTTLYIIDSDDSNLKMVDPIVGEATTIGYASAVGGESFTGMACDKGSGVMYAVSTDISESSLYTIDLTTGEATLIGSTGVEGLIDIACDGSGMIYGNCLVSDAIYQLDPATGASTYVGPTGYDANYAQSMAWDPATDQIFLAAYGASGELRLLDKTTGATSLIGGFADGAEVTVIAFKGSAETWLTVPRSGSVAALGSEIPLFTFDATGLLEGDQKTADVIFSSNPDVGTETVHVVMDVVIGIEDFNSVEVNLYPNPATEYVNIELSDQVQSFRILNTVGQTVYEQTSTATYLQVDVKSYEAGAYLIEFTTNDGVTFNKRFVVTK